MKRAERPSEDPKLRQAIADLEHALGFSKEAKDDRFYFAGITKSFETCVEYAWKYVTGQRDSTS